MELYLQSPYIFLRWWCFKYKGHLYLIGPEYNILLEAANGGGL
jgi:hypothetical protein